MVRIWLPFALCCALACDAKDDDDVARGTEPTKPPRTASVDAPLAKVETVLTLDRSAYGVKVALGASGWTLVTADGLYSQRSDGSVAHRNTPLSPPFSIMANEIVHWRDGTLLATPLNEVPPRKLAALERMPRDVLSSSDHFAWLERRDGGYRIQVAQGQRARTIYQTGHNVVSAAVLQDWVFVTEVMPDGRWRLAATPLHRAAAPDSASTAAAVGTARPGRPPAFLVAADDIYFYDGTTRSVRRVTPDLQEETVLARDVICSPMAVAQEVYCAHVGGVFALAKHPQADRQSAQRRVVEAHPGGPITAIAADRRNLFWVEDLGEGQLRVRAVRLP